MWQCSGCPVSDSSMPLLLYSVEQDIVVKNFPRIYLSPPDLGPEELQALTAAFQSNWIAPVGPYLGKFEQAVCRYVGCEHAVALSSGTAALHLAFRELGVGPGDRVFCSTLTFIASANAFIYLGAEPVFIDSERASWNMDPDLLEEALKEAAKRGQLPKAVEVVHAYGQCADIQRIRDLCQNYGVPLVEDAAEALGASYRGQAAGTFGVAGAFSFNGNKILTTSGGGMLVTNNGRLADRVRHLATQAREADAGYLHTEVGYNYRMSNLLASIGYSQVARLPDKIEERRTIFRRYQEFLGDLPGLDFMPDGAYGDSTCWLSCILLDEEEGPVSASELIASLHAANIEVRPVWRPLHRQPVFAGSTVYGGSVSEYLSRHGVCLPSSSSLTREQQDRVVERIRALFSM